MNDYASHYNAHLQAQADNAYRPVNLFRSDKDEFNCPKCNAALSLFSPKYADNKFGKHLVSAICQACKGGLYFQLPEIKKKRVYLDQSILSELYKQYAEKSNSVEGSHWRERLLAKIKLAIKLQKISVIVSNVHVLETVPMLNEEHQKSLWRFANDLAEGNICGDMNDALEYQLFELLDGQIPKEPNLALNCYRSSEIDTWSIHSPVRMTNAYRLRVNKGWLEFRNSSPNTFKETLENQSNQISASSTVKDCIEHLKRLYLADIFDGVIYAQILAENSEAGRKWVSDNEYSLSTAMPVLKDLPERNGYGSIIFRATLNHENETAQVETIKQLSEKIEKLGIEAFPSIKLQAILEGEVLHRWIKGLQANPKKFNENFGMSKVMDILHLAVFLPLVDVITVDKDTFNRCQQAEIKLEIEKYPCKLLCASKNQPEFEHWLDRVLNEPEDDEFKATRRLFCGMNLEEEERENAKLLEDLLARVLEKITSTGT
jgi:hypothetical protein